MEYKKANVKRRQPLVLSSPNLDISSSQGERRFIIVDRSESTVAHNGTIAAWEMLEAWFLSMDDDTHAGCTKMLGAFDEDLFMSGEQLPCVVGHARACMAHSMLDMKNTIEYKFSSKNGMRFYANGHSCWRYVRYSPTESKTHSFS